MQTFWRDTVEFLPILMSGVALTVIVTVGSLLLSTVLGLIWALMRVSGIGILTGFSGGLINVIRGIPIIVLLFYLYFVMPDLGITLTALQAAYRERLKDMPIACAASICPLSIASMPARKFSAW